MRVVSKSSAVCTDVRVEVTSPLTGLVASGDGVCETGGFAITAAHLSYTTGGDIDEGAQFIVGNAGTSSGSGSPSSSGTSSSPSSEPSAVASASATDPFGSIPSGSSTDPFGSIIPTGSSTNPFGSLTSFGFGSGSSGLGGLGSLGGLTGDDSSLSGFFKRFF